MTHKPFYELARKRFADIMDERVSRGMEMF